MCIYKTLETVQFICYKIYKVLFGVVDWLTRRISNLRTADRMGSTQPLTSCCFLEQETLHSLPQCWLDPGLDWRVFL